MVHPAALGEASIAPTKAFLHNQDPFETWALLQALARRHHGVPAAVTVEDASDRAETQGHPYCCHVGAEAVVKVALLSSIQAPTDPETATLPSGIDTGHAQREKVLVLHGREVTVPVATLEPLR